MADLLILTPLRSEAEPVLAALGAATGDLPLPEPACVRRYRVGAATVLAGWTGIGAEHTRRAVETALRAAAPRALLHLGVAGGLAPALHTGDLVLCDRLVRDGGPAVDCAPAGPLAAWLPATPTARGAAVTVERVVTTADAKHALFARTGALVVEMESFHAAEVAGARGTPFGCLRVVVDEQHESLPDLTAALDPVGRPRTLRLLKHLVASPRTVAALPRLAQAFGRAQETLGRVAVDLARTLRAAPGVG